MSPAGHWPQLRTAIEAGADSVYFGLKHFTARAKAGFDLDEIREAMGTLHKRGVRGFITFNTLVFEHELDEAAHSIAALAEAGADALIVQDWGIVKLAREIAPGLELHASTQMSITNAAGVRAAQELGVQRVTLARELSLDEVRQIIDETGCEIEIFVHGALCVAYSGQCFSSEAWGGRSANRGQCAQACRLEYEMLVDGRLEPLADARYLLSPGDLYALRQVPDMVAMGVAALKIEGRYKESDYVALTTAAYRKAVDEAWAGRASEPTPQEELRLEQVYSRGLAPHFISGTNHQTVVNGRAPRHRGVLMGKVIRIDRDRVVLEPSAAHAVAAIKAGDGVVFDAADWRSPAEKEEGARVYEALPSLDGSVAIGFGNGAVNFARVRPGDLVWRTNDPELDRVVRPFTEATAPVAKRTVNVKVQANPGEPLEARWTVADWPHTEITVRSATALALANKYGLTVESLRDQFERLGGSPYQLGELELQSAEAVFAPVSLLNQLRRDAVEALQSQAAVLQPGGEVHKITPRREAQPTAPQPMPPQLHVMVRTPDQLDAALLLRPVSITLDYLDLYGLRPSVERIKQSGIAARVASPRILKPGESRIQGFLASLDCALVVRSAGMLGALRGREIVGDFSLNAANSATAALYFERGVTRLTPTHDLNAEQVASLARMSGAHRIEAVAYQHLPVFHTEHCVFCRFLSTGTTYRDCGRPCEKHAVALRDSTGRAHPVLADVGCRNTVFGAEAQHASAHLRLWLDAGIRHFRLEFVQESADQLRTVVKAFQSAFDGRNSFVELAKALERAAPQGVTEGSLYVPSGYLTLPILQ